MMAQANKMNGFRKAVLVGTIVASFGVPLVGRAQEKAIEFQTKKDTTSIEYDISKIQKDREMAKENLRKEIEKTVRKIDSLQDRRDALVGLGEEAGYKIAQPETKRENELNSRHIFFSTIYFTLSLCAIIGGIMNFVKWNKKKD